MSDEKQEPQLMALLSEVVKQFSDYDPPRLRKDGDIVIPDAVLKKIGQRIKILPRLSAK